MKKFSLKLIIGLLPIVLFFFIIEYYGRANTIFGIKKKYLEGNLNSIQTLILGTSESQCAINPDLLNTMACNLAFDGQPISINYYLLNKYIDEMSNLNTVFLEVNSVKFYDDLNIAEWNGYIYSIFYNIKYKVDPLSLKNYSLVYSNYQYFTTIFFNYFNPFSYKYHINKFGYITNDFYDRFEKIKFDTALIDETFVMRYKFEDQNNFSLNKEFYKKIIEKCMHKGLKVVLITPPLYKTFSNQIPNKAKMEINSFILNLIEEYNLKYFDFSCDNRFNLYDFKDDNHLNSNGAKKFSGIINTILND